jgi:hypothetical protein
VLHPPLAVHRLHAPFGVIGDLAAAVRPEPGVVVDSVVRKVRGDQLDVTGVERLVIGADVVQVADDEILTCGCRYWVLLFVVRVKRRKGAARG